MVDEKKNATIYDVAAAVGVSLATVSRVVNGSDNVRPATRDKVLAAIKDLGYRPNAVARGLASKKTTTVGVVMPDMTNLFYSELTRGIDDVANMYQYDVLLTNTDDDPKRALTAVKNLADKQIDGLIFMGSQLSDEVLSAIQATGVPVVLAGSVDHGRVLPSVNIDYQKAFFEVSQHFLKKGQERLALVLGSKDRAIDVDYRRAGYEEALQTSGQILDESLIFTGARSYQDGQEMAAGVIAAKASAVVAYDDEVALGVLNGLQDRGVNVPEEVEIVSANNTTFTLVARPELSSIDQPKYDIGAVAMRMLTKLMDHENLSEKQVLLPYTMVKRNSTK
ncbi:substrate-binding domain-containing protein [Fructobacillus sp. M1-13]|uniref:Substrate-binding domain-containing protein n=1 Tax=Fructobacillus papyriferae TaxID=2713171 RepID=A0ABS5QP82_9LACO|nr:substrate-binding domain-containing protein [Fructobacillus papyriferae]MBS9334969.1 substrate-binding domain-containing protein [Fructobacillus papyriferae]MCD2159547.1 substrate-binding domain-containing protein [Fructobacillus papyriferae]